MNLGRLPALVRTTTFRLALVHASIFIVFTASLLAYLYFDTTGHLDRQAESDLYAEFQELSTAYRSGGFDRLNQSVFERSSARGKFFYLLQNADGAKASGGFDILPAAAPTPGQVVEVKFKYDARTTDGVPTQREAKGRISRLAEGGVLMVAYDLADQGEMNRRILGVVLRSAAIGLVLSLIGGVLISRSAAQRVESLAKLTEDVMGGDLTRRASVAGSGDEFDRLAVQLNAMLDKLERLIISTRSAGDAIAHDLRSPLTRLRNRLEAGLQDQTPDGPHNALDRAIYEVDGLLQTFNAILRLSRVQAGATLSFRRLNASGVTDELAELYEPLCEDEGLSFEYLCENDLMVSADRELIAQAMANLIDNAVKYTPSGGAITLQARRNKSTNEIELTVKDSGPGILAEDRDRVIERFVRLDQSRSQPGSGLGLSLVAAVAEAHRGRLLLGDGDPSRGTLGLSVSLILPSA
jgi:signal transduction histidine kinase